jgi:hypothetical protein
MESEMTSVKSTLFATALLAGFGISSASALPISELGTTQTTPHVDQVRMVCNPWGHCWWRPNYDGAYGNGWHHHHWWRHNYWARRHSWRYGRTQGW